jgi:hypothetical protein
VIKLEDIETELQAIDRAAIAGGNAPAGAKTHEKTQPYFQVKMDQVFITGMSFN